jgi:hypothetical protein
MPVEGSVFQIYVGFPSGEFKILFTFRQDKYMAAAE